MSPLHVLLYSRYRSPPRPPVSGKSLTRSGEGSSCFPEISVDVSPLSRSCPLFQVHTFHAARGNVRNAPNTVMLFRLPLSPHRQVTGPKNHMPCSARSYLSEFGRSLFVFCRCFFCPTYIFRLPRALVHTPSCSDTQHVHGDVVIRDGECDRRSLRTMDTSHVGSSHRPRLLGRASKCYSLGILRENEWKASPGIRQGQHSA